MDKLKDAGFGIVGIGLILGLIILAFFLIEGGVKLGEAIYPYLATASGVTIGVTFLILLPLSLFKRTRYFSASLLLVASFVFGLSLWIWALILTYYIWGIAAVFIGLFLLGVGVVPIAMLATLFNGMWPQLLELIVLTVLVFGVRAYSLYLANKVDQESLENL